jgi:hypothetical protein
LIEEIKKHAEDSKTKIEKAEEIKKLDITGVKELRDILTRIYS